MTANAKTVGQGAEKKGVLNRLNRLSFRNKVIGVVVLVFLALLVLSIPGDRNELLTRQERVEAAQIAYDLAFPAVSPIMESVKTFLDGTGVDLSDNRLYTGLEGKLTTFNRASVTTASQFQAVVMFHRNVHALLEAVPELDTNEFRAIVTEMDTTLSVAFVALLELNTSIDEYNGYHSWISAQVAGALFGLPQNYTDPVPARNRLDLEAFE
ncbi:MAG: hypothetical protein JW892_06965 [Anaerolineae bacterium]|nr:hypothetical protein [Anaerolineae bacterium]